MHGIFSKIKNFEISSNENHKKKLLNGSEFLFKQQPPHFIKFDFFEKIAVKKLYFEFQCGFQPKKISISSNEGLVERCLKSTTEEFEYLFTEPMNYLYIEMKESYDPFFRIHIEKFKLN